jgi:hypothetical protein
MQLNIGIGLLCFTLFLGTIIGICIHNIVVTDNSNQYYNSGFNECISSYSVLIDEINIYSKNCFFELNKITNERNSLKLDLIDKCNR